MSKGIIVRTSIVLLLICAISIFFVGTAKAQTVIPVPTFDLSFNSSENPQDVVNTFEILSVLTILAMAPSILIMMTSFTRIIIVLSFVRNALGTQQMPPNQVLIGIALFLTFFIMAPIGTQINDEAIQPYINGQIEQQEASEVMMKPIREFMLKQTENKDLALFVNISRMEKPESLEQIPTHVLIPSFIISELRKAFQIGFLIYIPFIMVDMIVASTLMSMGMMMLPPVMISLPFKILLFVLVDGWNLVIKTLVTGFNI